MPSATSHPEKSGSQLWRDAAFHQIDAAIVLIGADALIAEWNLGAERLFGYTAAEAIGRCVQFMEGAYVSTGGLSSLIERAFQGSGAEGEIAFTRSDGRGGICDSVFTPLYGSAGEIIGVATLHRDAAPRLAERDRLASDCQVLRAERRLQESEKLESLGRLAGGIAHDFNNLLTGVLGGAALAGMDLPPSAPAHQHFEQIEATAVRAADLCKQLLAYSGKGGAMTQRVDLNKLLHDTEHLLQASMSKEATIRLVLTPGIGSVAADVNQLRQIVMNLVSNASEALGERSGFITISTSVVDADPERFASSVLPHDLPDGKYICLRVSDDGAGMTPATQAKIFEPFFTTKVARKGLGLAAVLGIVRRHSGALIVTSELEKGSAFEVLLPASEVPADTVLRKAKTPKGRIGEGKALVVDDESSVRTIAARMIESFGFSVLVASDGQEAVERFATASEAGQSIVLVLLDLLMPNMDGIKTFQKLVELQPDVRVVLMSGYSEQDAFSGFQKVKPRGFVQKPFTLVALREKVQMALADLKR